MPRPSYPKKNRKYSNKNKKATANPSNKPTKKAVQKMVKQEIARNVENKLTNIVETNTSIITVTSPSVPQYFVWAPSGTANIFSMAQGTANDQRIGNRIKLKRWIVKGAILPSTVGSYIPSTELGYVHLYLLRRNDYQPVTSGLVSFYQNGSTSASPDGSLLQTFSAVNKDVYKVYWSRTYKMGSSNLTTLNSNNDFSLVKRFGFDICKLIAKNKILKYDDAQVDVEDQLVDSLTLVAVWQNASSDVSLTPAPGITQVFYNVAVQSYAEYEDA